MYVYSFDCPVGAHACIHCDWYKPKDLLSTMYTRAKLLEEVLHRICRLATSCLYTSVIISFANQI